MITQSEIINEVLVEMGKTTTAAYYTDAILSGWLSRANKRAAAYKKWAFTEGRISTTYASLATDEDSLLYMQYPEGWKTDSVRLLTIGGASLKRTNYYKYRSFLEDNPNSDAKMFTDYGRRVYINGNSGLSGTVTAWGQYTPAKIDPTDPDATTIFTGEEEGNEALVEMMIGYAYTREKKYKEADVHMQRAKQILDDIWERLKEEAYGYHTVDDEGMFKRIDVIGGALREDTFKRDQWY